MADRLPAAFMSYVHADDRWGQLTELRERLSDEIEAQTGEPFQIFQDRVDIGCGEQWQERIEESRDTATFLIPIIAPRFFGSQFCRDELRGFLQREKQLRRNDLILPVYFIGYQRLNDSSSRAADELLRVIASHQYADWRDLRFESFTSSQVGKRLEQMAGQICTALERGQTLSSVRTRGERADFTTIAGEPAASDQSRSEDVTQQRARRQAEQQPSDKSEPPIRVVDPLYQGNDVTINAAIKAAQPGSRILIRPGLYREALVIDKPLEVVGNGAPGEVVVEAKGQSVILFKTTMGRIANVVLRQVGANQPEEVWYGVDITQGRLDLEDCEITNQSGACVAIRSGADPRLRRNRIHDGKMDGIYVGDNGQGC